MYTLIIIPKILLIVSNLMDQYFLNILGYTILLVFYICMSIEL